LTVDDDGQTLRANLVGYDWTGLELLRYDIAFEGDK
jgi:hypothetical protein